MSYQGYTPAPPAQGNAPATTTATPQATATTYPYSAYHPSAYAHPGTPGAYSYPAGAYQTGVTSYGWPYPYSYMPQHPAQAAAQAAVVAAHTQARPAGVTMAQTQSQSTLPAATTAHVQTAASTPIPQRTATFSAYTPSYPRETVPVHSGGRGGRKQSNFKGLFQKERE